MIVSHGYTYRAAINIDEREAQARRYLKTASSKLTEAMEAASLIAGDQKTLKIRIFNATPHRVLLKRSHLIKGAVWRYPLDQVVESGQWTYFLAGYDAEQATGFLVFRVIEGDALRPQPDDAVSDVFIGWDVHKDRSDLAYCEVRGRDHWRQGDDGNTRHMINLLQNRTNIVTGKLGMLDKGDAQSKRRRVWSEWTSEKGGVMQFILL